MRYLQLKIYEQGVATANIPLTTELTNKEIIERLKLSKEELIKKLEKK